MLFATDQHIEVEATWGIYQRMIAAYRAPDQVKGRELMRGLIDSVSSGVPQALTEIITLGRTLKKRTTDVLAYDVKSVGPGVLLPQLTEIRVGEGLGRDRR